MQHCHLSLPRRIPRSPGRGGRWRGSWVGCRWSRPGARTFFSHTPLIISKLIDYTKQLINNMIEPTRCQDFLLPYTLNYQETDRSYMTANNSMTEPTRCQDFLFPYTLNNQATDRSHMTANNSMTEPTRCQDCLLPYTLNYQATDRSHMTANNNIT